MRESGILLHITSLPGPDGIGSLGRQAYQFVDFLKASGMSIWQVLPVSPTGFGESPYQSFSTYAGNPLLIDLDLLREEGLLEGGREGAPEEGSGRVDYPAVIAYKTQLLRASYQQSRDKLKEALSAFYQEERAWLEDCALFYGVKTHFGGGSWMSWPDESIRKRQPEAMARYRELCAEDIGYQVYLQYLFFSQWRRLKTYANQQGVALFGDMPIYVAMDSADCWANPEIFRLDIDRRPLLVAGVPPDYFSQDGQLWGNPLYDWKALRHSGYSWWLNRLRAMGRLFDLLRVDHFIGFANYYAVPFGAATARFGAWRVGPGRHFFQTVKRELGGLKIIAEDLGVVNARVGKLLRFCGYPGMKVLTFGFGNGPDNQHLPRQCRKNCVYYTGTHDNDTARGWWQNASEGEKHHARTLLSFGQDSDAVSRMVQAVMASRANRAMLPMQDILGLDGSARMNSPGKLGGNWGWRLQPGTLNEGLSGWLLSLNLASGRGRRK
ncbi:MAG: 4-alpha-glucanotransferase [Christensenellales bacterium]